MQEKQPKKLHGNKAKVDPKGHVESLYQSNRVTLSDHTDHEAAPIVNDDDVAYARRFSEENKK